MPFTYIFILLSLLFLLVVFGLTYRLRGAPTALIVGLGVLIILGFVYFLVVYGITAGMG